MKEADVKNGEPHFNLTETLGLPTVAELNQMERNMIVRTEEEQQSSPYPDHIMTRCFYAPQENCAADDPSCLRWNLTIDIMKLHPCAILRRKCIDGVDWYDVRVEVPVADSDDAVHHRATYVPRYAIRFSETPYSGYAHGVFRRSIGLPEGIMPTHWLDQEGGEEDGLSLPGEDKSSESAEKTNESGGGSTSNM